MWAAHLCSTWPLITLSLAWACSCGSRTSFQEKAGLCMNSWVLNLELAQHCFHCIPWIKASHKTSQIQGERKETPLLHSRKARSHCRGVQREESRIVAFFFFSFYHRQCSVSQVLMYNIFWKGCCLFLCVYYQGRKGLGKTIGYIVKGYLHCSLVFSEPNCTSISSQCSLLEKPGFPVWWIFSLCFYYYFAKKLSEPALGIASHFELVDLAW